MRIHNAPGAAFQPSDVSRSVFGRSGFLGNALLLALVMLYGLPAHAQKDYAHEGSVTNIDAANFTNVNPVTGIAVDTSGNVYVVDPSQASVYKETLAASTYTRSVVMTGLSFGAANVAVDKAGNVYVADPLGGPAHPGPNGIKGIVYKATLLGGAYTVSTVTDDLPNPYGITVDAAGDLFLSTPGQPAGTGQPAIPPSIFKETPSGAGYTESSVVGSGLRNPLGVAVDASGNLFIADEGLNYIVKETLSGGTYTLTATIMVAEGLTQFGALAIDGDGNLYASAAGISPSNTYTQSIFEMVLSDGPFGGIYSQVDVGEYLNGPFAVAVGANKTLYTAALSSYSALVLPGSLFKATTGTVNFGNVPLGSSSPVTPVPITMDQSYGGDSVISPLTDGDGGKDFADAGTGTCNTNGSSYAYAVGETCTINVVFTPSVAGTRNGVVQLGRNGSIVLAYVTGTGTGPQIGYGTRTQTTVAGTSLKSPNGIAVDANGNLYISDTGNNRVVLEYLSAGKYTQSTISPFGLNGLGYTPQGIALDASGIYYIADSANARAVLLDPGGGVDYIPYLMFSGIGSAQGVAIDTTGNLYVADAANNLIWEAQQFDPDVYQGYQGTVVVSSLPLTGLNGPTGIAEDGSGNIYIADAGNNRVLKETLIAGSLYTSNTGSYMQSVVATGLSGPGGLAVDGVGNIYVSDTGNNRILEETLSGGAYTQSVVPTTGLSGPTGIAVDGLGTLYVSDTGNNRLLKFGVGGVPSLSFASTPVGSTSSDSPQTVTIQNVGNAPLIFPVPASGYDPSITTNFTFSSTGSTACPLVSSTASGPATLAAGASCTIPVSFTPTTSGSLTGTLTLTDNNLNVAASSQAVPLSGTGTALAAPVASLAPTSLTFPSTTVGSSSPSQTITLTNTGIASLAITGYAASGSFTVPATTCGATLAAGAACTYSIVFTPAATGAATGTFSVTDNAPSSPQYASLTGTGAAPVPVAVLAPNTLTFPSTTVGSSSSSQAITLSNTGNGSLAITSDVASAGFTVAATTCGTTLASGATCTYSIVFTPTATGAATGTFTVTDNAPSSPQYASLTGTGAPTVPAAVLSPNILTFPSTTVGSSSPSQTIALSNTGTASLAITSYVASAGFTVAATTCGTILAAGVSCTYSIVFTPTTTGAATGTFTVTDNAPNSPQYASLTGTGAPTVPAAVLSPNILNFPSTTVGSSSPSQTITLSNTGNGSLAITSDAASGNFSVVATTCGTTLASGAACTYSIIFTPTTTGPATGTFTVTDSSPSSPQYASLAGTGAAVIATDFVITSPTPLQSTASGGVSLFTINVAALSGSYNTPIALSVSGLPAGATASFTPSSVTPGTSSGMSLLSIQTPSLLANSEHSNSPFPWLAALLVVPLFAMRRRKYRLLSLLGLGILSSAISGCGGGYFGDQAHTYTLTVTGTSSTLQHSTTVTLTIQ